MTSTSESHLKAALREQCAVRFSKAVFYFSETIQIRKSIPLRECARCERDVEFVHLTADRQSNRYFQKYLLLDRKNNGLKCLVYVACGVNVCATPSITLAIRTPSFAAVDDDVDDDDSIEYKPTCVARYV